MPPGRLPKEDENRIRRVAPTHGWQHAEGAGWQFGEVPEPPAKLLKPSREAWSVWLGAWFAWFWTPEDLPGLRQLIRLYDQVERGEFQRAGELRLQMDTYGITPKGQQDRRWRPRAEDDGTAQAEQRPPRYEGLRAVGD